MKNRNEKGITHYLIDEGELPENIFEEIVTKLLKDDDDIKLEMNMKYFKMTYEKSEPLNLIEAGE